MRRRVSWPDVYRSPAGLARFLLGPRETWWPVLALVLPAAVYLAVEGPRLEPFEVGAYAKMEIYTRLAAEGAQRVGTESRFQFHQPGPSFFYAAAPVYVLLGETTRAMAAAALVWNTLFVVALVRSAHRLAPGSGPLAAALALGALLWVRGPALMTSWFNIHVALLPFALVLLASARLATGEGRALPLLVLATSVVLQSQLAWLPGVAIPAVVGLVLFTAPVVRRALRVPTCGAGLTLRTSIAAALVALALWTLPVIDEFTGEYRNFHRLASMSGEPRAPTPWRSTLRPAAHALSLARDRPAADAMSVPLDAVPLEAALAAGALVLGGWWAARRRAGMTALALVTSAALVAVPVAMRYVPGRSYPAYLFEWASLVSLAAFLVGGSGLLGRAAQRGLPRPLAMGTLAVLALSLSTHGLTTAVSIRGPRSATSIAIEDATDAIRAKVEADLPPGRRFLVRVAARENQDVVLGLILALDKTGLRFGVKPFGTCRLEGHLSPRGDEWAELLVGRLASRPDAVPIGSVNGIAIAWQRLWGTPATSPANRPGHSRDDAS